MQDLNKISTKPSPDLDEKKIKKATKDLRERLGELQNVLYAQAKHSVLVIFQGMDASGKDGAVRKVFSECHPQGIQVVSFKKPTEEEFAHDFLWRVHKQTPAKGMIHIFNRSHYEDVLLQPDKFWKHNSNDWKERERWADYRKVYQDVIDRSEVPWYIVPVDERWYRDYIVAKTMVEELEKLNMQYPPLER